MLIESTWGCLAGSCYDRGLKGIDIDNMKLAYIAGVYAASAALIAENAKSKDISEAAFRLESSK